MALFRRQQKTEEMPKNILDALQDTNEQPQDIKEVVSTNTVESQEQPKQPEVEKLPEYLLTDPEVVGYTDPDSQNQFYNWAFDTTGVMGDQLILDQGCGRGDFLQKLNGLRYIGIDINPIMTKIANEKYPGYNFQTFDWLEYNNPEVDWAFNIFGMLKPKYDSQQNLTDKYQLLKDTIEATTSYVKKGFVLLLLADNGGVEEYQHFELSKVVELLTPYSYVLDRSVNSTVFKVTIYNQ